MQEAPINLMWKKTRMLLNLVILCLHKDALDFFLYDS